MYFLQSKCTMRNLMYAFSTIKMLMRSLMSEFSKETTAGGIAALNFGRAVIAERIQFGCFWYFRLANARKQ